MKKLHIFITIALLFFIFWFSVLRGEGSKSDEKEYLPETETYSHEKSSEEHHLEDEKPSADYKLGLCPTMIPHGVHLAQNAESLSILVYPSSAYVIHALKNGEIDIGLVGRIARESESISDANELRLRDGYTLVSNERSEIEYSQLLSAEIHTYLNPSEVSGFIPEAENIIYHDSIESAFDSAQGNPILISWEDYQDSFELVVPMQENERVDKFRIPTLYYYSQSIVGALGISV